MPSRSVDDGFGELVDVVDAAGGMHPTGFGVESLVDEELAPGDGAVGVQPVVAGHLQLGAEEEAGVRVDEQQRVSVPGVGGGDGEAVRALRLAEDQAALSQGHGHGPLFVESLQLCQRHPLDVAADAAFAEKLNAIQGSKWVSTRGWTSGMGRRGSS